MTRRRALAIVLAIQAVAIGGLAIVALDLYAHKRVEMLAGRNIWGYRGAVAHQKEPREIRVAVIGGTRAFGLGMPASWTVATVLRQQVMLVTDRRGGEVRQVVSLTLAQPGALPDSYVQTLEHYAYLKPDYFCVYDDGGVGGAALLDETSGVFARTGYWPALPLVLREKGMIRGGGAGAILRVAGAGLARIDRALAPPAQEHRADDPERYAAQVLDAVGAALDRARGVVVALSPAESPRQTANRAALLPRLASTARSRSNLRIVDLSNEPLLLDPAQRLDDWNYGGDAVAAVARAITPAVLDLIARTGGQP